MEAQQNSVVGLAAVNNDREFQNCETHIVQ